MLRTIFCGGVTACGLMLATVGWAHPGHGASDGGTVAHYLVEPNHLMPWLVAAVLAVILHSAARRRHAAAPAAAKRNRA